MNKDFNSTFCLKLCIHPRIKYLTLIRNQTYQNVVCGVNIAKRLTSKVDDNRENYNLIYNSFLIIMHSSAYERQVV